MILFNLNCPTALKSTQTPLKSERGVGCAQPNDHPTQAALNNKHTNDENYAMLEAIKPPSSFQTITSDSFSVLIARPKT